MDFALVAYREEGAWQVAVLPPERVGDLDELADELRRYPGDFGAIAMISIDEDFFLLARVAGASVRLLLSDVTAATEWPIARDVVDELDLPLPDDDDNPAPAGDLGILADQGMDAMQMGALLDDLDAYPDEMLAEIAERIGIARQFDELVGVPTP
ncbi:MAG: tRNA adenosine deaminase-associated protein [Nocardioidaceae bacterium]|nr:MAG: tRNA adenosine deaminase-associated protein [Nocardioidaceae bacterium]